MSAWLIALVGGIYLLTAADLYWHDKPALAFTYFAYALSNVGLFYLAR